MSETAGRFQVVPPAVDPEVLEWARRIVKSAESGEVKAGIQAVLMMNGDMSYAATGLRSTNAVAQLIGYLEHVKLRLLNDWNVERDEPTER